MLIPNTRIAGHSLFPMPLRYDQQKHLEMPLLTEVQRKAQRSRLSLENQATSSYFSFRTRSPQSDVGISKSVKLPSVEILSNRVTNTIPDLGNRSDRTPSLTPTLTGSLRGSAQSQQINGVLKSNDRLLKPNNSYMDEYRLRISPGKHRVEIMLRTNRFLPKVQLLDSRSNRVLDRSTGEPAQLSVVVDRPGSYRLRVLSDRPRQVGGYQLRYRVAPVGGSRSVAQSNGSGFNSLTGYGLVNAAAAVARALGQEPFSDVAFDESATSSNRAFFWGLNQTQIPEVWARGYRGQGVTIAVVDDGINQNHPALQNTLWRNANELPGNGIDDDRNGFVDDFQGWNFADNDNNVQSDGSDASHGTFIAGVIAGQPTAGGVAQIPAAAQNRILGVAPDAKLMAVKVISGSQQNYTDRVAAGIRYAVDNGANIINFSLGFSDGTSSFSTPDPAIEAAFQYARQRGVLVVMAAGNERDQGAVRPSEPAFGAARDLGIAVGAIDRQGTLADFSNPAGNQSIDYVTAPGDEIFSTYSSIRQQSYSFASGTSFAAPFVAGVAALMLSAKPTLSPAEIEVILTQTAKNVLPN